MTENTFQQLSADKLLNRFKGVYDPEVGVNVVDLGLIYDIKVDENNMVEILMTLTSPFCPMGDYIINNIIEESYDAGASDVKVTITFQPEWGPDRISDEGKLELGLL